MRKQGARAKGDHCQKVSSSGGRAGGRRWRFGGERARGSICSKVISSNGRAGGENELPEVGDGWRWVRGRRSIRLKSSGGIFWGDTEAGNGVFYILEGV